MTKNQIDNLINFCFHFHSSMGFRMKSYPVDVDWDYVVEKWSKYIGIEPTPRIFTLILTIETKSFISGRMWLPSELIYEFENFIGDPEKINKKLYNGLHPNIKDQIDFWLENEEVLKDWKSLLRNFKLDELLN